MRGEFCRDLSDAPIEGGIAGTCVLTRCLLAGLLRAIRRADQILSASADRMVGCVHRRLRQWGLLTDAGGLWEYPNAQSAVAS